MIVDRLRPVRWSESAFVVLPLRSDLCVIIPQRHDDADDDDDDDAL